MKKIVIIALVVISGLTIFFLNRKPKAVINFQFDDGCSEDSEIVEIFDSCNLKCGFALESQIEANRVPEYLAYQEKGYSILAHSTDGEPMNDIKISKNIINDKITNSKEILEEYDFNISGWVTPSSQMCDEYKPLLKDTYKYAYTNYYGAYNKEKRPYNLKSDDPNELYRLVLYTPFDDAKSDDIRLNNIKLAIDETIANNGYLTIYFHSRDLQDVSRTILIETLNYINEKIKWNKCKCLAPNEAYEYYFN